MQNRKLLKIEKSSIERVNIDLTNRDISRLLLLKPEYWSSG